MSLLQGKIVCVTGASRGIGRAAVLESVKQGASGIIAHYYGDEETTKEAQSLRLEVEKSLTGCKAILVPGDIAKHETCIQIVSQGVEAFGRIDVLVSNAGICPWADFLDMSIDVWERTRQVNLDGAFYVIQAVANQMKRQQPQGGSIIAISSISALVGGGLQCHYTPTKAGLLSLMQSCAIALGPYNIRTNAILPGTIATDINKDDLADEAKRQSTISRTCLKRLGTPEDVAGPVVFLASDLARYVTGASLLVDGGLFVNLQ
ncbi:NAD-P-binding protein [Schizopora paradoxa]|uniref:NAD-P-binding protein n=1 Tax=Schizopora paradoxa TaxID=27342 RepID=A0A0H2RY80_9AGAM|nr:NAD-P-binding protein [Schizopora paradoxa]